MDKEKKILHSVNAEAKVLESIFQILLLFFWCTLWINFIFTIVICNNNATLKINIIRLS